MGNVNSTVYVYFTMDSGNNKIIQCLPSSDFVVPPQTTANISFVAIAAGVLPQPEFIATSITPTGRDKAKVGIAPIPGTPLIQFIATITNPDSSVAEAGVTFKAKYATGNAPPVVIDGGSTIRNKGTSIWVERVLSFIAGLLVAILGTWITRQLYTGPG